MQSISDVELPSLSPVALRLVELCGKPDVEIRAVVEAVSVDAALAAKLLKVANSAYYGQQRAVDTLHKAAVILGLDYLKVVALSFHLVGVFSEWRHVPLDLRVLWRGNVLRACLARQLASGSGEPFRSCREQAFLVGLLQDLVVPVIALAVGDRYAEAIGGGGLFTTAELVDQERSWVDDDHASLGAWLCEDWRFPPTIAAAIRGHHTQPVGAALHDPPGPLRFIAYWVGAVPFDADGEPGPICEVLRASAASWFGFDAQRLSGVFASAAVDYDALRPVFARVLPDDAGTEAIMTRARKLISGIAMDELGGVFPALAT